MSFKRPDGLLQDCTKSIRRGRRCLPDAYEDVKAVAAEVAALQAVRDTQPENEALIRGFERQMGELVEGAQRMAKPIAF